MHCNSRQPDAAQSLCPLFSSPVPSLNSLSLSVAVWELSYCSYVTLPCDLQLWPRDLDPWPLTLNICSRRASQRSKSVRNLSEIGQSAAELLQLEYLTLWPWTCITCCDMLWDSLQSQYCTMFTLNQARSSWNVTIFMLIRHITLWPWSLTRWPWKFVVDLVSRGHRLW